jgi:hypothetical protein
MFATTVQAGLNATLHVCESGLQDTRIFLGLVPTESSCTISNGVMAEMGKDTEGGGHNLVKSQRKRQTIINCIGRRCFVSIFPVYLYCCCF